MMQNRKSERFQGKVTTIARVIKADTAALVTNGTESTQDDSFAGSYMAAGKNGPATIGILEPFFKPATLMGVCEQNNILLQCVEAMEVNIDGTGHTIELIEGETDDETEKKMLEDFFHEPYPMKSMVSIRRDIRRDMESTGNGYMEVVRNAKDEVLLVNYLDCVDTRLIRLDDPVVREMPLMRGGKEVMVQVRARERRFVQLINGRKVFFREFNASRQVNRDTGEWETIAKPVPFELRASEVIHFTVNKEARTPYGAARWINQLPSALGSRKAEEFNLSYFDAGGLPPLLVLVQGGYLGTELKADLERHLNGGGKHRAAIVEAISSSGSLDSSGTVQIRVERFGSERQSDAMFQAYDKNCEEHIRVGFRLPQMFIGRTTDVNFATAQVAYMVAEAQVFGPERLEFDTKINSTVVRALGAKKYKFKSLPVTLSSVTDQLAAMKLVAEVSGTDQEEFVNVINKIVNLSVEYKKMQEPLMSTARVQPGATIDPSAIVQQAEAGKALTKEGLGPQGSAPPVKGAAPVPAAPAAPVKATAKVVPIKKDETTEVLDLASRWAALLGLSGSHNFTEGARDMVKKQILGLSPAQMKTFNEALAMQSVAKAFIDIEGLGELCGCATHLLIEEA